MSEHGRQDSPVRQVADAYVHIAQYCGIGALLIGIIGLAGWVFRIPVLASIIPGYKPIAISAAIAFIVLGGIQLIFRYVQHQRSISMLLLGCALGITVFGLLEIIYVVTGVDVSIEDIVLRHFPEQLANPNANIAPAAGVFIFLIGLGQSLFLFRWGSGRQWHMVQHIVGLLGSLITLGAVVFVLGYIYGTPFFYGSAYIPISALATLASLLLGLGLVMTAGKEALPLRWLTAASTQARLLRAFLPLTTLVLLLSNALQYFLARTTHINPALSAALLTMLSVIIIGVVVLQVAGTVGTLIDRTESERRTAEAELRVSEETFRAIFNSVYDAIFLHDVSGELIDVNDSMLALYDVRREEIPGTDVLWYSADSNPVDILPGIWQRVLAGETPFFSWRARRPHSGEEFDVEVYLRTLQLHGREMIMANVRDVTARKHAEEALRVLTESLEQRVQERTAALEAANKELEAFSYSVSHDLRAPLRSIDGFSKILLERYQAQLDTQGQEYLTRVRNATQRMSRLIDEMLNLSRIGRVQMRHEAVDLSEIAALVIDDLRQRDPERQVTVDIMPDLRLTGDASLLRIVLDNLLGNAWKFTAKREDARVAMGMTDIAGERVYYVRDNGAGFDMSYADKLFTPFQRLHSEEEFPGTGIGLAIVQRIIARHGGRVWAEGQEGKGATIYFTVGDGVSGE